MLDHLFAFKHYHGMFQKKNEVRDVSPIKVKSDVREDIQRNILVGGEMKSNERALICHFCTFLNEQPIS